MREKKSEGQKTRVEFDIISTRVLSGGQYEICVVASSQEDAYFSAAMSAQIAISLELKGDLDLRASAVTMLMLVRDERDAAACFTAKVIN